MSAPSRDSGWAIIYELAIIVPPDRIKHMCVMNGSDGTRVDHGKESSSFKTYHE